MKALRDAKVYVRLHKHGVPPKGDPRELLAMLVEAVEATLTINTHPWPMTQAQVEQWIDACNHEPARQVLRDYLQLRARPLIAQTWRTEEALHELRVVAKEMRERKVGHGGGTSPTLHAWAQRIEDAVNG